MIANHTTDSTGTPNAAAPVRPVDPRTAQSCSLNTLMLLEMIGVVDFGFGLFGLASSNATGEQ